MTHPHDHEARGAVEGNAGYNLHFHAEIQAIAGTPRLYLDMDGVLADFDKAACAALGTDNSYKWEWVHGTKAFWAGLNANPNFFLDLEPMPDAMALYARVAHLRPTVLTALPKSNDTVVADQKRQWIARYLGADVPVCTCLTSEKPQHCRPGDVLVDDRAVNRKEWQRRRGHFVLHTSAAETIAELEELGVI